MDEAGEHLRCTNLVHVAGPRGAPEPTLVCSCPAGLIHMHDCPVSLGRTCLHFRAREGAAASVPPAEHESLHERLMDCFLTRAYFARVRTLAPGGGAALERQRAREEDYAGFLRDLEDDEDVAAVDAGYERERTRLQEYRHREDEAHRNDDTGLDAAERARRGIKTVVEKAQETVAAVGNVASSYVDDIELPQAKSGGGAGAGGAQTPSRPPPAGDHDDRGNRGGGDQGGGGQPRRRRRRRRRGRNPNEGGGGPAPSGGGAPPAP